MLSGAHIVLLDRDNRMLNHYTDKDIHSRVSQVVLGGDSLTFNTNNYILLLYFFIAAHISRKTQTFWIK